MRSWTQLSFSVAENSVCGPVTVKWLPTAKLAHIEPFLYLRAATNEPPEAENCCFRANRLSSEIEQILVGNLRMHPGCLLPRNPCWLLASHRQTVGVLEAFSNLGAEIPCTAEDSKPSPSGRQRIRLPNHCVAINYSGRLLTRTAWLTSDVKWSLERLS